MIIQQAKHIQDSKRHFVMASNVKAITLAPTCSQYYRNIPKRTLSVKTGTEIKLGKLLHSISQFQMCNHYFPEEKL